MADEMTRQEFAEYMTAFEQRLDARFAQVDARFDDLKQRITIQFEDVRGDIRFSLEAVTGLREMTERRFDEMRADHEGQIGLLKTAVHHLSRRVDAMGPPEN